jgi:tetratricopeptide (TPR) repeat protein
LLTKLRRFPYAQDLEIEASRLRWPIETDVHAFRQALAEHRWAEAVQLYSGELLRGFALEGAPEFTSWLELERAELRSGWGEATLNLADELEGTKRYAEAAQVLERLYKTDSLDETTLKRYLRALHLSGERPKALTTFASFKETLQEELEVEPETDTLRLVERIKSGESLDEGTVKITSARERHPRVKMPTQATPFIGRDSEKAKLYEKLSDPVCRLFSIVGPGGIGKTRLAIEAASEQQEAFRNGVYFAPFDAVSSADFMVPTLASALDFTFFGSQEPRQQLLDYLQDKEMLLVMDNLEHLLEGMSLIADILASSPNLKILATSRERLNLHAEWVFDLEGLSYPTSPQPPLSRGALERSDKRGITNATTPSNSLCRLLGERALTLRLMRRIFTRSSASANSSRACRSPSSWRQAGCACSASKRLRHNWRQASTCSRPRRETSPHATKAFAPSSNTLGSSSPRERRPP